MNSEGTCFMVIFDENGHPADLTGAKISVRDAVAGIIEINFEGSKSPRNFRNCEYCGSGGTPLESACELCGAPA